MMQMLAFFQHVGTPLVVVVVVQTILEDIKINIAPGFVTRMMVVIGSSVLVIITRRAVKVRLVRVNDVGSKKHKTKNKAEKQRNIETRKATLTMGRKSNKRCCNKLNVWSNEDDNDSRRELIYRSNRRINIWKEQLFKFGVGLRSKLLISWLVS